MRFSGNALAIRMLIRFRWLVYAIALGCEAAIAEDAYKFLNQVPIGGEGGWDILTIDSGTSRLYLSHGTKVVVVDLNKNTVVAEIADTPGVHGFIAVPDLQLGFSSNGKENKSSVVDLATLKTISKVDTGESPDAIVYAPRQREVYVFNHRGNSVTVIEAKTRKVVTTIPLDGNPEFAVADQAADRIYCNIEDKSEVAVIDPTKHQVVANWPLAPGEEPSGIALDGAHHRLFAACHNKMMVMLNTETGKVIMIVPIGAGTDGAAFDDAKQLVFASCGEGVVTMAHEDSADKLSIAQTLKTERGARTIALDPRTHRIYLPTAQFQPPSSPSPGATPSRPTIVPNTLKLLVYGPTEPAKH